ncbi:MAG: hypothetical protein AAF236_13220 [Verrucomicrobiota bacterium]
MRWNRLSLLIFTAALIIGCNDESTEIAESYPMLNRTATPPTADTPLAATVILEMIEVDSELFSEWSLSNQVDPTQATSFRREVQRWIKDERARVYETAVINGRSGGRSSSQSVREVIYPGEYRYPIRETVTVTTDTTKPPNDETRTVRETVEETLRNVAPSGHAFTTREVGMILKVDLSVREGGATAEVALAAELIHYFEDLDWSAAVGGDEETFAAPVFEKNAYQTRVTLPHATYGLIGGGSLPDSIRSAEFDDSMLLVFLRADCNRQTDP